MAFWYCTSKWGFPVPHVGGIPQVEIHTSLMNTIDVKLNERHSTWFSLANIGRSIDFFYFGGCLFPSVLIVYTANFLDDTKDCFFPTKELYLVHLERK